MLINTFLETLRIVIVRKNRLNLNVDLCLWL